MENASIESEQIERPTTPGISYTASRFRDILYYSGTGTTEGQKQEQAYGIFAGRSEQIKDDLATNNNARLSLSIVSQVLNFKDIKHRQSAQNFVEDNFDNIAKRLTFDGLNELNETGEAHEALSVLTRTLDEMGYDDPRSVKYLDLLVSNKDHILEIIRGSGTRLAEGLASILFNIRQKDKERNPETTKQVDGLIESLLFVENIPEHSRYCFFRQLQKDYRPNLVYELFKHRLEANFKDSVARQDIADSLLYYSDEQGENLDYTEVYRTLAVCREIDQEIPGGSERLNKIFGITHFGRYPASALIEQLNDWDNGDSTQYGVIIGPWGDWNNAFSENRDEKQKINLSIINGARKFGFKTRIIEAKTKEQFVMRQLTLRNRFNKAGKFCFLGVSAHGNPEGFRLDRNNWEKDGHVRIEDIPLIKKDVAELYAPFMQTFFFSCSTGVAGGFAELWADSRIESIGPDDISSVKQVEVFSRPGGLLGFRVEYRGAKQNRYPGLPP